MTETNPQRTFEWKDGGSEPFKWTTDDNNTWAAVWVADNRFVGWVMSPRNRYVSHHPTETAAMAWCEQQMTQSAFVCPLCGLTSHHPRDAEERYCTKCGFIDDILTGKEL